LDRRFVLLCVMMGRALRRWAQAMLLAALAVLAANAAAQPLPVPEPANKPVGAQASVAELAVSAWSQEDLLAWWAALRAMDGNPGQLPPQLQPPSQASAWSRITLPDVRPRVAGQPFPSKALYQMRWYKLRYASPSGRWPTSVALYLPRLVTLAAAVLVRTDEGWRPVFDNQSGAREQWVRPLWAVIPAALTELHQDKEIEIIVAVPVLADSYYAVSSAWFGAREELEPRYNSRWALQIGVPQASSLTLVMLGLFSLSLWARRRDEPAYLLFALAAAAWLLRNLHYHLDLPHTRLGLEWFWWVTHASMSWVMLLTFMFALRFAHQRVPLFERLLVGFVLVSSAITAPPWLALFDTLVLQHLVNAVVGAASTVFVVWLALRQRSRELNMIAASLIIGLCLGVHDLLLLAGWAWPEHIYLMPFATLVIMASFLYAVQRRYVGALCEVEQANASLAERLLAQGQQLQAQHDRLSEAERQQALLLERQRLMQDMHDGLGSSLLSAMVAVEQGGMHQEQVVEVLRECVDDLRLVIDSLEPLGHDLVALLATMRYRLGKRLQSGGLTLEWDVHDLPMLEWLEPPDALHVLRLMQEALSNVLKHAKASRVRIATRHRGAMVEIRVEDDGCGFDLANAERGRGLKSQLRRARYLGGTLHLDTEPGHGTRLALRLPVVRHRPTGLEANSTANADLPAQQTTAESGTIGPWSNKEPSNP